MAGVGVATGEGAGVIEGRGAGLSTGVTSAVDEAGGVSAGAGLRAALSFERDAALRVGLCETGFFPPWAMEFPTRFRKSIGPAFAGETVMPKANAAARAGVMSARMFIERARYTKSRRGSKTPRRIASCGDMVDRGCSFSFMSTPHESGSQGTTANTPHVVVRGSARSFLQEVTAGNHTFRVDEPESIGGTDAAPDPYDYVLAGLGACTSMTVGLYARRKGIPLDEVVVSLHHSRIHAKDCEECETKTGMLDHIDVQITLNGQLSEAQRATLMEVAAKCPVHRTLKSEIRMDVRRAA